MKIAVLLSGFPRSYEKVAEYNKEFYSLLGEGVDFFISTYNFNTFYLAYTEEGRRVENPSTPISKGLSNSLLECYPNSHLKISSEFELQTWINSMSYIIDQYPSDTKGIEYTIGKLYSIYTNYKQVENVIDSYDIFILSKLDQVLYSENSSLLFKLLDSLQENTLYTTDFRVRKGSYRVEENFLLFNRTSFNLFVSNFIETIGLIFNNPTLTPTRLWRWPLNISLWCIEKGLDVRSTHLIQSCIVRNNPYLDITNLSLMEIKEIESSFAKMSKQERLKNLGY